VRMFFVSEENTPLSFFMTDDGFLVFSYTVVSRMKDRAKSGAREEVKKRPKTKKMDQDVVVCTKNEDHV